jgi:hypothetical protein
MKRLFLHSILAGVISALLGITYFTIYQSILDTRFDSIVNMGSIAGASFSGCLIISIPYALLLRFKKQEWVGWLNIMIMILSFISILGPLNMTFPTEITGQQLFPGLVVPTHFFPSLTFFSLSPFFLTKTKVTATNE